MANNKLGGELKVKRLIWDIEVCPNVGLFFSAGFKQTIGHDAIIQERRVICIGFKWEGESETHVLRWDSKKNDRELLRKFLEIAAQADELVAHFGDSFDLPWVRTRCLILGLDPLPLFKTVDTKAWASKYFFFNSNKLDYVSKVLGFGGKEKMEFEDWKNITLLTGAVYLASLDKMCFYCGKDVERLEEVFSKLKAYVKPKTHAGVFAGRDKWTCPSCGSENVAVSKRRVTSAGTVQWQMKCNDCGSYFTISQQAYENYLIFKTKHKLQKV